MMFGKMLIIIKANDYFNKAFEDKELKQIEEDKQAEMGEMMEMTAFQNKQNGQNGKQTQIGQTNKGGGSEW